MNKTDNNLYTYMEYDVFYKDEHIGILMMNGYHNERFIPNDNIVKYEKDIFDRRWLIDTDWTYIPFFENRIYDALRFNQNMKMISSHTDFYSFIRKD